MMLRAIQSGDGPPVVMLHGLFGAARNFGAVQRALAPRFRVIALDMRNYGDSLHAPDMRYATLAADVRPAGARMSRVRTVMVLNGANLNLLGTREPGVYGSATLADVEALCVAEGVRLGVGVECRQTNHEGELLDWVHDGGRRHAAGTVLGAVLNPGAWTHTSIALRDASVGSGLPVIECHISNVHARETFRQHSFVAPVAAGIVVGFGVQGYALALAALVARAGVA
jgi:3-dehydroquinate dehydratase-2